MAASPNIKPQALVGQPSLLATGRPALFLPKPVVNTESPPANDNNYKTGQILAVPQVEDSKVVSPYQEALDTLSNPPDKKQLKLDPKASGTWFNALNFFKESAKKISGFGLDVVSDAVPAAGYAIEQAGVDKKTSKLFTHAALGGAALVALSSVGNFIDTFKSIFHWRDSPVPGLVDAVDGLAKLGFAGLITKKAVAGEPLPKQELIYGGSGLIILKLITDAMKGVGPFAHIPGIKDIIKFTQESLKAMGSGSLQGGEAAMAGRAE